MSSNTPEQRARANIDWLLCQAGWAVQDLAALNVHAARGVAVREFPLRPGHGTADYLLYPQSTERGLPTSESGIMVLADRGRRGATASHSTPGLTAPLCH